MFAHSWLVFTSALVTAILPPQFIPSSILFLPFPESTFSLGSSQVPYMQLRENNWTVNADVKGKWNIRYDL